MKEAWNKGLTKSDERVKKYIKKEDEHSQWKGGVIKQSNGYIYIHNSLVEEKFKSMCDKKGYVLEHRYVMAKHLDRSLDTNELVHHKDEDKTNNSIHNLELTNRKTHLSEHHKELLHKAHGSLMKKKDEELQELHDKGIITATEACDLLGVYHSTVRRRQNKGLYSKIKTKYNGICLYKSEIEPKMIELAEKLKVAVVEVEPWTDSFFTK